MGSDILISAIKGGIKKMSFQAPTLIPRHEIVSSGRAVSNFLSNFIPKAMGKHCPDTRKSVRMYLPDYILPVMSNDKYFSKVTFKTDVNKCLI